uniref:NADH-ubiquinone oxidoreductase chain 2 n=1 Tax=Amphisbaena xera TaxID=302461 RepID=Q5EX54_9SAUR|nr:NADH dehydrogenase subunit 2 [Amphisbaena xera]
MNPYVASLLVSSFATGTIIAASSNHWLMAWIGLELNTLAVLPLMAKTHTPRATESAIKYFLTQTAASIVLLLAITMNAHTTGQWDITQTTTQPALTMLTLALAMKLGIAPLHAWLPEVMQGTTLKMALIMATWQKLAPFTLLYTLAHMLHTPTIMMLATISILLGGWAGLNQTQLRKLMAFSSIAHLGWIIAVLTTNKHIALITLALYICMTTTMFTTMLPTDMKSLQDTATSWTTAPPMMLTALLTLISLGGLPPTTGFLMKWFILKELTFMNLQIIATLMATASLLSLLFYIRITYVMTLTISPTTPPMKLKWRLPTPTNTLMYMTIPITVMALPLTPLLITN